MTLLTNRGFQVFIIVLAAIGAVTALLVTNTINQTTGVGMLSTVIGLGLGVPLTPGGGGPPAPLPTYLPTYSPTTTATTYPPTGPAPGG